MNSAEIVASNDDLLQEILIRVPIKPLSRFQLVSKHWHSLISNPRFCCRGRRRNPAAVGLFLPPSDKNLVDKKYSRKNWGAHHHGEPIYYIYNPTTNKFSTFPKQGGDVRFMHLVFDPSKSHHYKVVCIKDVSMDMKLSQLEVYSSETRGPWVKCGGPFKCNVYLPYGVYWNGAIHWLELGWYMKTDTRDSLYFNPDDRHHRMVGPQSHFNVYEMRTDYSEWFVKYRVEACNFVDAYRDNLKPKAWWRNYKFAIYTMVRGDKEEDSFLILKIDEKITKYNLIDGAFETIYEFDGDEPVPNDTVFQYIESMCHV
ncbi:hypothetical protein CASFOL_006833 [Castilleja foliolosa]|uniref:F-box domain-containing protein n=1 Tax=Castilleja foliolosa TaxID=1961234 RepID=A0ABD3E7H6_9LAMI